jgi:hypothetical protein
MTPYPGTVDFKKWEIAQTDKRLTRYWLIPPDERPKLYTEHPTMSSEDIRLGTQRVWDDFYSLKEIWVRARCVKSMKAKLAFVLVSKLYRQMYANTGIATDSARKKGSSNWARWMAKPLLKLFRAAPMPGLTLPQRDERPVSVQAA